ncbi:MAG: DNA alkylation repair protein [Candidatus Paceibacterota bacterium]
MKSEDIVRDLNKLKNKEKAKTSSGFFKTKKGQYGYGDKFLGITVPEQRKIAKKYKELKLSEIQELLKSPIHENRFTALEILVMKYENSQNKEKEKIAKFYLKNTKNINNWDLVDASASYILGDFLYKKDRGVLYKLVKSENLWERRIAVVSTYYFIKRGDFKDIIKLSEILLKDKHDLIQKAVGWMLREAGKRDQKVLLSFLDKNHKEMPRTMLRYSLEKLSTKQKNFYMKK